MATYTTTQDGNWNTDATWGGGGHPTSNDDIAVIGHDVTYDAGVSAVTWGNITLNSGGMLVFPINASSTIKFNATAILTVNNGGELRTGSTSAVGSIGTAYTLRFEFPQGAAARYVLVLNDGAIVNIQGADVTQYAYLDSDWTSGQSFYAEGDYSSLWSAGQKFYIHRNANYVANGYQTQGDVFTIASVGSYDAGNDRTQITISDSAPNVTFTAVHATTGYQSKLILVTRNVVLCDPAAALGVYDYNNYAENIRCDLNQTSSNFLVNFVGCLFSGWSYVFDGGYNLLCSDCCFVSNYYGVNAGTNNTITGDFVSNSYGVNAGTNNTITGDFVSNNYGAYSGTNNTITGDFVSNYYGVNAGTNNTITGDFVSNNYGAYSGTNNTITGDFVSNNYGVNAGTNNTITGDFVSNSTNVSIAAASIVQNAVLEDCLISSSDRLPYRVYNNAGNVLPLVSEDFGWQTPNSGETWIMQAIANSYCNFATRVNQIPYSPLRDMATYAPASSTTLTIKIWPVGWTTSLDQDDVVLGVKYLDTASGVTRTTVYNTSQTYANGAWRECSVTFTPAQAGIVYFNLYFRSYESGAYVLIDPIWSVA